MRLVHDHVRHRDERNAENGEPSAKFFHLTYVGNSLGERHDFSSGGDQQWANSQGVEFRAAWRGSSR
jgi:hypothetical protein